MQIEVSSDPEATIWQPMDQIEVPATFWPIKYFLNILLWILTLWIISIYKVRENNRTKPFLCTPSPGFSTYPFKSNLRLLPHTPLMVLKQISEIIFLL